MEWWPGVWDTDQCSSVLSSHYAIITMPALDTSVSCAGTRPAWPALLWRKLESSATQVTHVVGKHWTSETKYIWQNFNITNYFIEAILMLRCLRTPNDRYANVVTEYMIFSMRHVGLGLTLEHHDQLTLIQPHTHMVSGHETFLPGNITSWAEPCLAPPLSHHHQHLIFISETVKF